MITPLQSVLEVAASNFYILPGRTRNFDPPSSRECVGSVGSVGQFHVFFCYVTDSDPCNIPLQKNATHICHPRYATPNPQVSLKHTLCVWTTTTEWIKSKWHVIWAVQNWLLLGCSTWYTTLLGWILGHSTLLSMYESTRISWLFPGWIGATVSTSQRSADFGRVTFPSPSTQNTTKNHPTCFFSYREKTNIVLYRLESTCFFYINIYIYIVYCIHISHAQNKRRPI